MSLFPFLAVLVSAMGALILLLLVVTRKLHHDAVARAKAEQVLVQSKQDAQAAAARNVTPLPLPADHPAFQTNAAEFVIAIKSPAKQLLPPAPPVIPDRTLEKEALRREWESRTAELRDNWERIQQRLREAQTLVNTKAEQEAHLAAELARLQAEIDKLRAEQGGIQESGEKVKTTTKTIARQVAELLAELERLKAEKAAQADKFQLVPYAGNSPTRRRPIVIECEASTIRFASEDITLTASEVSGFNGEYNPVRAGTEALLAYWEAKRQAASSLAAMQPQPYLMFVIRPGGTVSYYVTRRMLEGLQCDSGYELVTQSQELVWPQTDPEAKVACQTAIDEVLGARSRLAAQSPGRRVPVSDELQYEGQKGEFILEEVQKLRNPDQKTFVGGQRIYRAERPQSGAGGYKPPTAPDRGGFVGPRLDDLKDLPGEFPTRRPTGEALARDRSIPGRPFTTEPPPRFGQGAGGSADVAAKVHDAPAGPGSTESIRKMQPGWESQYAGAPVDPDRMLTMSPEELARRSSGVPTQARGAVGNVGEVGRGEGRDSGEATSQFADRGEVQDLLSSQTGHADQPAAQPHDPTNALRSDDPDVQGQPGGNRTSAVETTDDPAMAGESTPSGVAGGKGTFNGEGGSSAAAPDSVPVQPGSSGPTYSPEDMIAKHLPRPLPRPTANSITAERYVIVTIDSNQVQIGNHKIPIEFGESDHDLEAQFSEELAALSKRWGRPPAGFHWQPVIRFRVLPGGNQYYAWLRSASQEWEMRNTVEYVFE